MPVFRKCEQTSQSCEIAKGTQKQKERHTASKDSRREKTNKYKIYSSVSLLKNKRLQTMDKSSQKKFFFREIYRFLPIVKEVRRYGAILATGKEGNWKIPLL